MIAEIILVNLVPAVWGAGALYLVWGTERSPPFGYPMGMGLIGSLLWLAVGSVPIWVAGWIPAQVITASLLIAALVVALETISHTIRYYDLGHRTDIGARIAVKLAALMPGWWHDSREQKDGYDDKSRGE